MNNKPNFQTCCREVAEKMWPDVGQEYLDLVYDIHTTEVTRKAAKLYADRCVEEAVKPLRQALMDIMAEIELYKKAHPRTP